YTAGVRRLPVSVASIVAMTEVPFAALVSFFTLGERLDGWQALGAAAIVMAVVILTGLPTGQRPALDGRTPAPAAEDTPPPDLQIRYSTDR
ncbi:MAG: hypothetical protein DDG58_07975, partial [Ardenticatenia bacterium]